MVAYNDGYHLANFKFFFKAPLANPDAGLEGAAVNDLLFFGVNIPLQKVLAVVFEFDGYEHFKKRLKVSNNHCRNERQCGQ
jgi:hypothetical protein